MLSWPEITVLFFAGWIGLYLLRSLDEYLNTNIGHDGDRHDYGNPKEPDSERLQS